MNNGNNTNDNEKQAKREFIPLSGEETAQIIFNCIAAALTRDSIFSELVAYPGAKVEVLCRITPMPVDPVTQRVFNYSQVLDFSQPPDVVRIISGLPIYQVVKVALEGLNQTVDRPATASPELVAAASKLVNSSASSTEGKSPAKPSTGTTGRKA